MGDNLLHVEDWGSALGTFDAFPDANSLRTTESAYSLYTITARFVEI